MRRQPFQHARAERRAGGEADPHREPLPQDRLRA
jgi:hypothetical protein